jgi:hypothetical protein
MSRFELELENDRWLNIADFIKFCHAYKNQDIIIDVNNEGHCLRYCGVYDILDLFTFSSVTIQTSNMLEWHPCYIIHKNWDLWLKKLSFFDRDFDCTWNQGKIFGCFYNRPSACRLGISGHLARYHDKNSLIVTRFIFSEEWARKHFDIERLFTWNLSSLENLFLLNHSRYQNLESNDLIEGTVPYTCRSDWFKKSTELSYLYKNIMIDIVSEPSCSGDAFYPTEKIVRAIMCKRPFIVMANKNYLLYLRQLGFQTFYEFWDEDYDGFGEKLRYLKILELIDDIGKLEKSCLAQQMQLMTPILDHNYDLIINQKYKKVITKINESY